MANRTIAEQITVLEARRDALETALTTTTGGHQSVSMGGMSVSFSNPDAISKELIRVNKSLQRLYRGGRGIVIDMSYGNSDSLPTDQTSYTRVVS